MNEKNRNLVVRIVTAVVLLPLVVTLLVLGGWWTAGLVAVAAAACALEYEIITQGRLGPAEVLAVLGAGLISLAAAAHPLRFTMLAAWILWAVFIAASVQALFAPDREHAPTRTAHVVTGCLYAGLGLGPIAALRVGPEGLQWVISALVITWANDTCAYFAGRLLGRHKLHPAVSPNKTWEGFAGGAVGSVAGMFIARWVAFPALTATDCLVLGLLGAVLGPLGDLCESLLKRAHGVKDSGTLIPGHGGLLDRVDALLFNAPAVYLYVVAVRALLGGSPPGAL
ncbi:MAG: phosphatidate cytidylyltransferase [Myxococcaceae bacterium]|nr:MAG: phosphatidate cytidylyltransferase [Myxococcaceae bacterium]